MSDQSKQLVDDLEAAVATVFDVLTAKARRQPPFHEGNRTRTSAENREQSKACIASLTSCVAIIVQYVDDLERPSPERALRAEIAQLQQQLSEKEKLMKQAKVQLEATRLEQAEVHRLYSTVTDLVVGEPATPAPTLA